MVLSYSVVRGCGLRANDSTTSLPSLTQSSWYLWCHYLGAIVGASDCWSEDFLHGPAIAMTTITSFFLAISVTHQSWCIWQWQSRCSFRHQQRISSEICYDAPWHFQMLFKVLMEASTVISIKSCCLFEYFTNLLNSKLHCAYIIAKEGQLLNH